MSTPAGSSMRCRESTVLGLGSRMSRRRLWMRISKCSRESLSLWGLRITVQRCFSVGSGTGPRTLAWVRTTVSTIFFVDWSTISWSYAFSRMRIFWAIGGRSLLQDLHDAAGTDRAATLADGEAEALVHGDGLDQL